MGGCQGRRGEVVITQSGLGPMPGFSDRGNVPSGSLQSRWFSFSRRSMVHITC
jgi:hypothetical protein